VSRQNEELVRAGYEWFNREHEPAPTWHPEGEYINASEDPDHAVHRGIEAIRAHLHGWVETYPDLHVEPLEILANGDIVFVWTRFTGHGAGSGAAMEMELGHVVTIEDAKLLRLQEYFDRGEALKAAGL
jgi:ketosteroid isomerase-like protein